jgi:predicted O-methyltransferase YrrM
MSDTNDFLRGLLPQCHTNATLAEMSEYAADKFVPIIAPETEQFLRTLLTITQPANILEIGTAIGYSALVFRSVCSAKIVTIEKDVDIANIAHNNFQKRYREAGDNSNGIRIIRGDAREVIAQMPSSAFEFIFVDAAKGQYIYMLDDLIRLCAPRGIIVCDNVLYKGEVASGEYPAHKQRTIVTNLRRFLAEISDNPSLSTTILPLADGISVSVKIST